MDNRLRPIVVPCLLYVLAFSFLPHKELRFIIYVFPFLNIATAVVCARASINRCKSIYHRLCLLFCGFHLIGNVVMTLFLLLVSRINYPGGVAMSRLHRLVDAQQNVSVHIGDLAAQSGVSRFTELNPNWSYYKEDYTPAEILSRNYSHLLVEAKSKHALELKYFSTAYNVLELVECFDHIGIEYKSLFFVRINTRPCIFIMARKPEGDIKIIRGDEHGLFAQFEEEKSKEGTGADEKTATPNEKLNDMEPAQISVDKEPTEITEAEPLSGLTINEEELEQDNENDVETISEDFTEIVEEPLNSKPKPKKKKIKERLNQDTVKDMLKKLRVNVKIGKPETDDDVVEDKPGMARVIKGNKMSNIRKIIKTDETRKMIEDIGKLDLSELCDFETMTVKDCLRIVIDEYDKTDDNESVQQPQRL